MSRHRNVRKLNYDEECEIDDVYGRSAEEDFCISPTTAAEYMYDRGAKSHDIASFFDGRPDIPEEPTEELASTVDNLQLNHEDQARLISCLDYLRDIVGHEFDEKILKAAIVKSNFNAEDALKLVLDEHTSKDAPKPQRVNRRDRRRTAGPESQNADTLDAQALNGNATSKQLPTNNATIIPPVNVVKGFSVNTASREQQVEKSSSQSETLNNKDENTSQAKTAPIKLREVAVTNVGAENAFAEYQRQRGKELLNLVVIGHVDAGKSTLMGHLLCLVGAVSQKTMHKYEQESKKIGKASFAFAWVLDETGEERSRGITMDVAQFKFETTKKVVTLLDAPGHKDFIPNMITGASQADVAILVVDATRGEFETGFESGGQTREHALLVRSLGVSQLTVAVNKLDTVSWSQERFQDITKKLSSFLRQAGYKEGDISYIPCSGLTGENLIDLPKESALRKWYEGPTLLQQIDYFKSPERPVSKPFRMSVGDVFKGQGSGFCVAGRIETGFVSSGEKVIVMPQGETALIKSVVIDDLPVPTTFAGDSATITLSNIDMSNVIVGSILCSPAHPIQTTTSFQARIVVFNVDIPITKGFPVILHYQSMSEPAVIKKLVCQLHKSTGEVVKKKPRCIGKQTSALIEIETSRPICLEVYKDIKELGRFMLRTGGQTIAAGLVTQIF